MSSNQIKSLLKQAEVYRKQGLLNEAEQKYELAAELIQSNKKIQNKDKLLAALKKKLAKLKNEEDAVESAPTKPQMSGHVNELIKKLFSSPDTENDPDAAALEGAIALAKFGQFEGAIGEFSKLIDVDSYRVAAAKNILRCHITLDSTDKATAQFEEWQSDSQFPEDQLEQVRGFFEDLLDKKGIKRDDMAPVGSEPEDEIEEEEEFLDISAVAITLDSGPRQGEQIELDVSFQSGNIISLIISGQDETLIESLQVGVKLDDVHFYSPIAIFRGTGTVAAKTEIASGPKQGDYSLDIKIESI